MFASWQNEENSKTQINSDFGLFLDSRERKRDTRRKIEFGGLVVKAGMEGLPKDVILGALIHASQSLGKEEGARALYQSLGKASFENYG